MKTFEVAAEQFECHPAGMNSIKESVLYCVGTSPDNYLVWGDVATWVTATATLLLFFGGWLALRATKKQISEAREIAHMQQRNEALTNFASALRELAALSFEAVDVADLRRYTMRALTAGEHWALSYPLIFESRALTGSIDKLEKLISQLQFARKDFVEQVRAAQAKTNPQQAASGVYVKAGGLSEEEESANFITLAEAIPKEHAVVADICFQIAGMKIRESEAVMLLEEANARMDTLVPQTWRFIADTNE